MYLRVTVVKENPITTNCIRITDPKEIACIEKKPGRWRLYGNSYGDKGTYYVVQLVDENGKLWHIYKVVSMNQAKPVHEGFAVSKRDVKIDGQGYWLYYKKMR